MDEIEENSSLALKRALEISYQLIDDEGSIHIDKIPSILKNLSPLGRNWGEEKIFFQRRVLEKLLTQPKLVQLLETLEAPHQEPLGDYWIALTLGLSKKQPIKKVDAMRAALSAWLMPLRQHIGSCFATAPAILVQEEVPERLLKDLKDLLETGRLTRVIRGVEHQAPLIPSLGASPQGVIHPLLKAWEYTLASFAETKGDFASWNLYASLGFDRNEREGIGEVLANTIGKQLEEANRRMLEIQDEYKAAYLHLNLVESRLKMANSERELGWIRADYQSKKNEFNTLELLRDRQNAKAHRLAELPNLLVDHFLSLFPKYFQEVYDPNLEATTKDSFDDSPAGFRLLYKHGRERIAAWTSIQGPNDFINSLIDFFQSAERECPEELSQGLEKEISEVITAIVLHLRTKAFLETAFNRMAKAHHLAPIHNPLDHLDQIEKKPWAFTSGGTMSGLITAYFSLETPPKEVSRWVENPEELLIFLIDEVKKLPLSVKQTFEQHPEKSLLMHSPTHAFRLLPALQPFFEAWSNEEFTYTWVRDHLIEPQKSYYRNLSLDLASFNYLKEEIIIFLPQEIRDSFKEKFNSPAPWVSPSLFRSLVIDVLKQENGAVYYFPIEQLDALLFKFLNREKKAPPPILFADTNWEGTYFAFQVNPGTLELELWRTNYLGTEGAPMRTWRQWLDGTKRQPPWGIYPDPSQYTF